MKRFAIVRLYCGKSGRKGFYNSQEIGLAKAMNKLGYDCFVFYPDLKNSCLTEESICEKVTVVNVPAKHIGNHSKFNWNIISEYKIDVVEVESDNQFYAPSLLKFCKKRHILAFSYIGITNSDSSNVFKRCFMKLMYKRNAFIYKQNMNFAKSRAVKQELNQLGIKNVEIAPVGLDTSVIPKIKEGKEELKEEFNIPIDDKVILFVGRIDSYKHPEYMIKLIDSLPENYYGIMVGDGSLSSLIDSQIKESNCSNRLFRINKIANSEIHKFYRMADYFVNFNNHEIFGMSILEAMYQGCNVIAFHAPGPDEIINCGNDGYFVNSLNEMKDIIRKGNNLDSPIIKKRVKNNFLWDKTANLFDDWIHSKMIK